MQKGSACLPIPPPSIGIATTKTAGISFIQGLPIPYNDQTITYGELINQTIDWGNLFGISGGRALRLRQRIRGRL